MKESRHEYRVRGNFVGGNSLLCGLLSSGERDSPQEVESKNEI
jgi:hypothetical protein